MECPDPEVLDAFGRGGLDPSQRHAFEEHLDQCESCAAVLARLAYIFPESRSSSPPIDPADEDDQTLAGSQSESAFMRSAHLRSGDRLDRYTILEPIGAGGMGVVYAAYDADLDRKVALKVLHEYGRHDDQAQRRMLREAQAMARLSHPNVITVHEVRVVNERIFISMEFVEGGTLKRWLAHQHPLHEILEMFRGIGRGLAAAHAAGLVHRDVKPDNVLIGADQRPRVTDFGLALPSAPPREDGDRPPDRSSPSSAALAALVHADLEHGTLTRTGALVGTPAYMAPEQFLRQPTTAASDQFSFCVTLFEALYGVRPFAGKTMPQLVTSVTSGSLVEPEDARGVPSWLRQVVRRGLSVEPEDRFASMDALLAQLHAAPPRPRRRLALSVLAGGGLVLAGTLTVRELTASEPCIRGQETMDQLWTQGAREPVGRALAQGHAEYGLHTASQVQGRLDAYAREWTDSHQQACEAHQRGELSSEALDLRGACLNERRQELSALLEVLAEPDAQVRHNAVEAVEELPSLSTCEDLIALRARVPPPRDPGTLARVEALEHELARVRAHRHAGQYDTGSLAATGVVRSARQLGYEPLLARALYERGEVEGFRRNDDRAITDLTEAWQLALLVEDDVLAAEALLMMLSVFNRDPAHLDRARLRLADVRPMIERVRRFDEARAEALGGELALQQGLLEMHDRRFDEAIERFESAREQAVARTSPGSLAEARVLASIAHALTAQQEFAASLDVYQRVLKIHTERLGPQHPTTAISLNSVGLALKHLGRHEDSARHFERARSVVRATLRPNHPSVQMVEINLAEVYFTQDRHDEAIALYAPYYDHLTSEEIRHSYDLRRLSHYMLALARTERWERACPVATMVRDRAEQLGDTRNLLMAEIELARCALGRGDAPAALARLDQIEPRLEGEHPSDRPRAQQVRGLALIARGQPGDRERAAALLTQLRRADSSVLDREELDALADALGRSAASPDAPGLKP